MPPFTFSLQPQEILGAGALPQAQAFAAPPAPAAATGAKTQPGQLDIVQFIEALKGLYNPERLGAVAQSNTRPAGLTPADTWSQMFAPIDPTRAAAMTNHPQMSPWEIAQRDPQNYAANAAGASPVPWQPTPGTADLTGTPLIPGSFAAAKSAGQPLAQAPQGQSPLDALFALLTPRR